MLIKAFETFSYFHILTFPYFHDDLPLYSDFDEISRKTSLTNTMILSKFQVECTTPTDFRIFLHKGKFAIFVENDRAKMFPTNF